jgi:hypothetical protein
VDDFEKARQDWIAASEKLMGLQYENPWPETHFGRYREEITERENPPKTLKSLAVWKPQWSLATCCSISPGSSATSAT